MYTDAHMHLFDYFIDSGNVPVLGNDMLVCASAHGQEEFAWQETFARRFPRQVFLSFGIHPQDPSRVERSFLELLIAENRIAAIGECGFDVYSAEFRLRLDEQLAAWDFQLALAEDSGLPLVIHCRKALDRFFADSRRLKRVSAVVFHGWGGSAGEARSLLDRGVNAFFSAGKGLVRGDRSLAETVQMLPAGRILTETDAPYMRSKGERISTPDDIKLVAEQAASLMGKPLPVVLSSIEATFRSIFEVRPE